MKDWFFFFFFSYKNIFIIISDKILIIFIFSTAVVLFCYVKFTCFAKHCMLWEKTRGLFVFSILKTLNLSKISLAADFFGWYALLMSMNNLVVRIIEHLIIRIIIKVDSITYENIRLCATFLILHWLCARSITFVGHQLILCKNEDILKEQKVEHTIQYVNQYGMQRKEHVGTQLNGLDKACGTCEENLQVWEIQEYIYKV